MQYMKDENNKITRQQAQLLKNIEDLNVINRKMGHPLIKVEVKSIPATREYGVPQSIIYPSPSDTETAKPVYQTVNGAPSDTTKAVKRAGSEKLHFGLK